MKNASLLRVALMAVLATAAAAVTPTRKAVDLASVAPYDAFDVAFTLSSNGVQKPMRGCTIKEGFLPEQCMAEQGTVTWDNHDYVMVSYNATGSLPTNATGFEVRMCFSSIDTVARPWRAPGTTIDANLKGQCQFKINATGTGATLQNGTVKWQLPSTTPNAAFFPRVFAKCGDVFCDVGNTPSGQPNLFRAVKMNTAPPNLVAAIVVCSCSGPLILLGYILFSCIKGNKQA